MPLSDESLKEFRRIVEQLSDNRSIIRQNALDVLDTIDHLKSKLATAEERAEVIRKRAVEGLFCDRHKNVGEAAADGYCQDECPTCEVERATGAALRMAADFVEVNTPYAQGIGSVGIPMAKYILALDRTAVLRSQIAEAEAVEKGLECAKNIPDPEEEGFCESCGICPQLLPVQKHGYQAYELQHLENCWYGKVQRSLKTASQRVAELKAELEKVMRP